ncbi:hypothetical protein ACFX2C_021095 [Malus domestica]
MYGVSLPFWNRQKASVSGLMLLDVNTSLPTVMRIMLFAVYNRDTSTSTQLLAKFGSDARPGMSSFAVPMMISTPVFARALIMASHGGASVEQKLASVPVGGAVEMVLSKGVLKPLLAFTTPSLDEYLDKFSRGTCTPQNCYYQSVPSTSAYYGEERNQPFEPAELHLKSNLAAGER